MSVKREPRVYYLPEKEGKKATLVFDAGYAFGDIHIYEHKETIDTEKLEEELKQIYGRSRLYEEEMTELVALWVEKKLGYALRWKLEPR